MKYRSIIKVCLFLILSMYGFMLKAQECNVMSKANDIQPDKYCAPVTVSWKITYRGVLNVTNDADVAFVVDWGDGTVETIPFGTELGEVNKIAAKDYQAELGHIFVQGLNGTCNYRPQVWLQINGVVCTSSVQEQNVTVWDRDNANGGVLTIDEPVVYVCVGNDATVIFRDVSQWNCVPPMENDQQNNLDRWTQWIYGTAGTDLTNVVVGGTNFSSTITGPVDWTPGPVTNPSNPAATAQTIYVPAPTVADVGKRFYVTLNNWNFCNQYPGNTPEMRTAYIEVVDNPHPLITVSDPEVCVGTEVHLSASLGGGVWSSSNGKGFSNASVGTFNTNAAGAGLHTIRYTVTTAGGCVGYAEVDILVHPRPSIVSNVTNDIYLCPGVQFDFINTVSGGTPPYDYTWSKDVSPLSATDVLNPRFYTETPGKYDLRLLVVDKNQCRRSKNTSFDVSDVGIQFETDTKQLCQGDTYDVKFNVSGGSGNYTLSWSGDLAHLSGPSDAPVFNANQFGLFTLYCKVIDDGNCEFTDSIKIRVKEMPQPIIKGGDRSICGFSTLVEAESGLGSVGWQAMNNVSDISIKAVNDSVAQVLVNHPGTYKINRIENNDGCSNTASVNLTFVENPTPYAGGDIDICDTKYVLTGVPSVGSGVWSLASGPGTLTFDDQLKDTTGIQTNTPGEYKIVWQEDNNGCVNRDTVKVTFNALPVADFDINNDGNCSPLNVSMTNHSTNSDFYVWTFEKDAYSNKKDPTHTYTVPVMKDSVYTIELAVRSAQGCEDKLTKQIAVHPRPVAKLVTSYAPECSPALVDFENQSVGADSYLWNYGDGTQEALGSNSDVSHAYINKNDSNQIKSFYVNLVAENSFGCKDSSNVYLMVYPEANFEFVFDGNPVCESSSVMMTAAVGGKTYNWDFGNGKTLYGSNPIVSNTYYNPSNEDTTYRVKLEATSFFGCSDTYEDDLVVYSAVVADFELDRYEDAGTLDVNLFDKSKNGDVYIVRWGDGDVDTFWNDGSFPVPHQFVNTEFFPKVFNVSYEVLSNDGCRDSIRKQVKVYPDFKVDFSSVDPGCAPLQVQFENLSSPGGTYVWDFGDGSAKEKTLYPLHDFQSIGNDQLPDTFQVSLKGTSMWGYSDSIVKEVVIWPSPKASWSIFSTNKPDDVVSIENTTVGGDAFYWDLDDGERDTSYVLDTKQKLFPNTQPIQITKTVKLTAENAFGCRDSLQEDVWVNPVVESSFLVDTMACSPLKTVAVSNSIGAVYYEWSFDGAPFESGDARFPIDIANTSDVTQTHTLALKVKSVYGDESISEKTLYVKPMPRAAFIAPSSGVSPAEMLMENQSQGANDYLWTFGNGDSAHVANTDDISYTYTNGGVSPTSYRIQLNASNPEGCTDSVYANTIIYPEIIADFDCPEDGCPPLSVSFADKSIGALYYEWTIDGSETYFGKNLRYEFTNETLTEKVYTILLKVESAYGYTDTLSKKIRIKPMVKATFDATSGGLSPFVSEFDNQSINVAKATWDFGDASALKIAGSEDVDHLYTSSLEPVAYNPTLLIESPEGCIDSANASVMVYPPMEVAFTCPLEGCSPFDVNFENTSFGADLFEWNFGDGSNHWLSEDAFHRFENTTDKPLNYTVELIGQSKYGFVDTFAVVIRVLPKPTADFTITPEGGSPFLAEINNRSIDANVSHWYFDEIEELNNAQEFTHLFENSTVAPQNKNVSLRVSNSYACIDSVGQTVTVFPPVIADFDMNKEGCSPLTVAFENKSEGALRYKWFFGDGSNMLESTSPVHVFENSSTDLVAEYTVQMVALSQFGFSDTIRKKVRVMPVPVAEFDIDRSSGCAPLDITLTNSSRGDGDYEWSFGEISLMSKDSIITHRIENENFLPSYTELRLKITNTWGCVDEELKVVEAFPHVKAELDGDSIGCSPFMASLSNNSKNASDFYWTFDSVQDFRQHPLMQFDNVSDQIIEKNVVLIASSAYGCADTARKVLKVLPEPVVKFTLSEDVGSSPFDVEMKDLSENVDQYKWYFGDGDSLWTKDAGDLTHRFLNDELTPIGHRIELTGVNRFGCENVDAHSISVFPLVQADFTAKLEGCSPLVVDFENLSRGATRFEWIFGDETPHSVAANPSHVYESDDFEEVKTFEVKLVAFSQYGLADTMVKTVRIHPTPKPDFGINVQAGCSPVYVELENRTQGSANLNWTIGADTSFVGDFDKMQHTFINDGRAPVYHNVLLIAENEWGCVSQIQKVVEVLPGIKAEFECDTVGCSPHIVVFKNKSFNASHYEWSFGDGEISQENTPTYTYVNKSAHDSLPDVVLVSSNGYGCKDTFVQQLTIYPEPDFEFEVFPKEVTMPVTEVTIDPTIRNSGPWQFVWDFGDGTYVNGEDPGTHTYAEWGNYEIKVNVFDARCSDVQLKGVKVKPAVPYADMEAPPSVCSPATVQFVNLSEPSLTDLWDFGDGNLSSEENPSHSYFEPGSYDVSLMVFNEIGESDTFTTVVNVYRGVNADFKVTPQVVNSFSQEVQFTNYSENAVDYDWSFGDGDYSNEENPVKKYDREGTFDISLIAISDDGCRDTMDQEAAVKVSDVYSVRFPNAFVPSKGGSNGGGYNKGDPGSNNVFYPVLDEGNVKEYRLMIFNRWGLQIFESTDVMIGWDGYYRGELTPQGVYVWKVRVLFKDGNEVVETGDVTLIR